MILLIKQTRTKTKYSSNNLWVQQVTTNAEGLLHHVHIMYVSPRIYIIGLVTAEILVLKRTKNKRNDSCV